MPALRDCSSPNVQKTPTHTVSSGSQVWDPFPFAQVCNGVSLCRSPALLVLCLSLQVGQPRMTSATVSLGRPASQPDLRRLPLPPRSCIPRLYPLLLSTTPHPPTLTHPSLSLRVLPTAARGRCFLLRLRTNHSSRLRLDRLLSPSTAHRTLHHRLPLRLHHQLLQPISPAPAPHLLELFLDTNLRSHPLTLPDLSH